MEGCFILEEHPAKDFWTGIMIPFPPIAWLLGSALAAPTQDILNILILKALNSGIKTSLSFTEPVRLIASSARIGNSGQQKLAQNISPLKN